VSALNIGRHLHLHYRLILQSTVAMRGNAQPLTVTTFPTYQQKLLYVIQSSTHRIMSFNTATMELVPHYWYVTIALTMYQSCIVSKGPSTSVHAWHHQDCANIMKCISTLGQDAYARCWNHWARNPCSLRQQYTWQHLGATRENTLPNVQKLGAGI